MASPMRAQDLVGVYNIIPTPAVRNRSLLEPGDTVAYEELYKNLSHLIDGGVDGIMTNGTFGESATLDDDELLNFVHQVVERVNGRVPVFAGATAMSTRMTINRGRELMGLGATGLFLGRPMWCGADDDTLVGYYSDIADALPDAPIVIYDNPEVFKGKISPQAYRRLAKIPSVIGSKYIALGAQYLADIDACGNDISIMTLDTDWYYARRWVGDSARSVWTGSGNCGMAPLWVLRQALLSGDEEVALDVTKELRHALAPLFPKGSFAEFSKYNIPLEKARFAAGGIFDPGPARPPYHHCPPEYLAGAEESGQRWAALEKKYAAHAS